MNVNLLPDANDVLNRRRLTRAESARVNGAKSRGPTTPDGKKRSSQNAIRHGLTSRHLSPLNSSSGERAEYDHHLRGLVREYEPQTHTEWSIVETMARDWVRHGRIGQVSDNLLQPFSKRSIEKLPQTISELIFEHDTLVTALGNLHQSDRFGLTHEQQIVVRNTILNFVQQLTAADASQVRTEDPGAEQRPAIDEPESAVLRLHDVALAQRTGGQDRAD